MLLDYGLFSEIVRSFIRVPPFWSTTCEGPGISSKFFRAVVQSCVRAFVPCRFPASSPSCLLGFVCACTRLCVRMCIHASARLCVHASLRSLCGRACARSCFRAVVHSRVHVCVRACVRACICAFVHARPCTRVVVRTFVRVCAFPSFTTTIPQSRPRAANLLKPSFIHQHNQDSGPRN